MNGVPKSGSAGSVITAEREGGKTLSYRSWAMSTWPETTSASPGFCGVSFGQSDKEGGGLQRKWQRFGKGLVRKFKLER